MAEYSIKRKIKVILCADVKGYSRMTGANEVGILHTLSSYQEIIVSTKREGEDNAIISTNVAQTGRWLLAINFSWEGENEKLNG